MTRAKLQNKSIFDIAHEVIFSKENSYNVIIPHVCNNANVFEIGFSEQINKKYPSVKINYELLGKSFLLKNPGYVQFNDVDRNVSSNKRLIVSSMIAQNGLKNKNNKRPLNYAYLVKSMVLVKKFIVQNFNSENKVMVLTNKFGIGQTGGNWKFIECLIEDIWKDLEVVIYS